MTNDCDDNITSRPTMSLMWIKGSLHQLWEILEFSGPRPMRVGEERHLVKRSFDWREVPSEKENG